MTLSPQRLDTAAEAVAAKRAELQHLPLARIYDELSLAAISAYLGDVPDSGWQPIETAPKDGTQLLLWWDSKPVISYYAERTGFKGWQPPSMMPIKVTDRSTWNPTHWTPLPSAPSDPAQEPEPVAWRWQERGWGDHWVYNPDPEWLATQNNIVKQPLYTNAILSLPGSSRDEVLDEAARSLSEFYPDNANTNAFCAAIRSLKSQVRT